MDERRDNPGILLWAMAAALPLLALYGGVYWVLLDPDPQWNKTATVYLPGPGGEGRYIEVPADDARLTPHYRLIGRAGGAFFAPAHWVDCQLRRSKWGAPSAGEPRP